MRTVHAAVAAAMGMSLLSGCSGTEPSTTASGPTVAPSADRAESTEARSRATTSTTGTASDASPSTGSTSAVRPGTACTLITDAQVETAVGKKPSTHDADGHPEPGSSRCTWLDQPGADHRVLAKVYVVGPPAGEAEATFTRLRTASGTDDPPPHVGDRAYWGRAPSDQGPEIAFLHAGRFVTISIASLLTTEVPSQEETADLKKRTERLARAVTTVGSSR